jgi:hypothetical protein
LPKYFYECRIAPISKNDSILGSFARETQGIRFLRWSLERVASGTLTTRSAHKLQRIGVSHGPTRFPDQLFESVVIGFQTLATLFEDSPMIALPAMGTLLVIGGVLGWYVGDLILRPRNRTFP